MNTTKLRIGFPLLSTLLLLVIACSSSGTAQELTQATPVPTGAMTPTPVPPDVQASAQGVTSPAPARDIISSLKDVRRATIQIEAQGSFVDPALGQQLNRRGRGSGFIIDQSGLAVTKMVATHSALPSHGSSQRVASPVAATG